MKHRYLTHTEVAKVARETGRHETLIYLLAYGGPRWGEAVALTPSDIDGRRINIERSVTRLRGEWVVSTPKTHARRETWVPQFVADMLARQAKGKKPGELLFTNARGGYLRPPSKSGARPSAHCGVARCSSRREREASSADVRPCFCRDDVGRLL